MNHNYHRLLWLVVVGLSIAPARAEFEFTSKLPTPTINPNQERPWDLSVRAFFGYNDNFPLAPDSTFFVGDDDAFYAGTQINGAYRFVNNKEWTAGARLRVEYLGYLDDEQPPTFKATASDPNDYDMAAVTPSLFVDRRFMLDGMPAHVGLSADYRRERLHIGAGSLRAYDLNAVFGVRVRRDLALSAEYSHGWDDFRINFPGFPPGIHERDGQRDRVRLAGKWHFMPRRNIEVSYTYIDNNAEGSNWDYESHGFGVRLESHLIGPVWGAFQFDYSDADYGGFTPIFGIPAPGRTEQQVYGYTFQLLIPINYHWSVDLYYTHTEFDANQPQFSGDQNNAGFGVTYRF